MCSRHQVIQLLDTVVCLLDDFKDKLPVSYFDISIKKDGVVLSVKEDCDLTEYARYINNDNNIVIESSSMRDIDTVENMMRYFVHLHQEMKTFKSTKEVVCTQR